VHALILTGEHIEAPHPVDRIRAEGTAAIQRWCGPERFTACVAEFGDRAGRRMARLSRQRKSCE
jgi:hypothetical protein